MFRPPRPTPSHRHSVASEQRAITGQTWAARPASRNWRETCGRQNLELHYRFSGYRGTDGGCNHSKRRLDLCAGHGNPHRHLQPGNRFCNPHGYEFQGSPASPARPVTSPQPGQPALPECPLANNTSWPATITTGVKDVAGNIMATAKTWSFTTIPVETSAGGGRDRSQRRNFRCTGNSTNHRHLQRTNDPADDHHRECLNRRRHRHGQRRCRDSYRRLNAGIPRSPWLPTT